MDEKELLMHYLQKTTGLEEATISEIIYDGDKLKDGAIEVLLVKDADRVTNIKKVTEKDYKTLMYTELYGEATKKVRDKFETNFKEITGFESDLQGQELVKAYQESLGDKHGLTEDQVKLHPEYIALEKTLKVQYQKDVDDVRVEFDTYKKGISRNALMSAVKKQARTVFNGLNPVLSDDAVKAENQTTLFLERFDKFDFEPDGDDFIVVKDGKRLEDKQSNPIYLKNLAADITNEFYDIAVQQQQNSPSNTKKPSGVSGDTPKTVEEYNKMMANTTDETEMIRLKTAWDEIQA